MHGCASMFFGVIILSIVSGYQLLTSPAAAAASRYSIKFATVAPKGSTWMTHMESIDREVREKSKGRLGFRIYAGGIAGDELDVLKKIRIGQIHCAAFSGVGFGRILPMVRVMDLPFLFRDYRETDLVHETLRPYFVEKFREKGFELLSWAEVGNVHLISKKPIRNVGDLSRLKIWMWTGDPIAKSTFSAAGVNPVPLAITDVTTALSTGMIDTVYAPPLGALALQWHVGMRYMMALPLTHATGAVLVSSRYLQSLPGDLVALLKGTFEREMRELTSVLRRQQKEAIELIREGGVEILSVPEGALLEEFYAIHHLVARELMDGIYPAALLDKLYKILGRPR